MVTSELGADGTFSVQFGSGERGVLQFTQGAVGYPDDETPDLYTIGEVQSDTDVELGTVRLADGYDVSIDVVDADGADVTDAATIFVGHGNDGVTTGIELLQNPIEMVGTVVFEAEYDGSRTRKTVEVTESRTVTLSLESTGTDGNTTISGTLVDATGSPVTTGEVLALGQTDPLPSSSLDSDGSYSLAVEPDSEYVLQYTQGIDGYPDDGLPDLYSIGVVNTGSDVDVGTLTLPDAYDLTASVLGPDGADVTDEASIVVSHENDGAAPGISVDTFPVEVTGDVTVRAMYDGETVSESLTVTESRSVELSFGSSSGTDSSSALTGRLLDSTGSAVTAGKVLALGGSSDILSTQLQSDGSFSLDLADGTDYTVQFVQSDPSYASDGVPDLYTLGRFSGSGADLGDVQFGAGHEVSITVEDADGTDVTDDAQIIVSHANNDAVSGYGVLKNPLELTGDVTVTADYEGTQVREKLTVTSETSVVLTVE